MRWPIARNRVSAPTSSIAPVQAAGAEVRLWAASGERRRRSLLLPVIAVIFYLAVSMIYLIERFREVENPAQRLEAVRPPGSQNASSDKGKIAAIWTAHGALHHSAPVSWR